MVYEFETENTNKIEQIGQLCTKRSAAGWEFVQMAVGGTGIGGGYRWMLLFRRPKA